MSWESERLTKHISDGNVRVVKICRLDKNGNIIGGYYYNFQYQLNTTHHLQIEVYRIKPNPMFRGFRGFHSYEKDFVNIERHSPHEIQVYMPVQREGYNQKLLIGEYKNLYLGFAMGIVEGYLPKGSAYYANEKHEILSEEIMLTKVNRIIPCG